MTSTAATAAAALPACSQAGVPSAAACIASNGIAASSGIAAMSWNSSTANALRPIGEVVRLRSFIVCIAMAVDDSASARPATIAACNGKPSARPPGGERRAGQSELQCAAAEHRRAHRPEALRLELEPDDEQHQHDAELGKMQDRLDVLDEPQSPRTDRHAGEEIAEDGAQAQALRERHAQHRRGEIDERVLHHHAAPAPAGVRRAPRREPVGQGRDMSGEPLVVDRDRVVHDVGRLPAHPAEARRLLDRGNVGRERMRVDAGRREVALVAPRGRNPQAVLAVQARCRPRRTPSR